ATRGMGLRFRQYASAAAGTSAVISEVKVSGGRQSRLNKSDFSKAKSPCLAPSTPGPMNCVNVNGLPSLLRPSAATGAGMNCGGLLSGLAIVNVSRGLTDGT